MIHAATGSSFVEPILLNDLLSNTAKSFDCKSIGISAISSKNKTPFSAASIKPALATFALVNAPFSWPNNSDSIKSLGKEAQST